MYVHAYVCVCVWWGGVEGGGRWKRRGAMRTGRP